ncbi:hypothetical protein [Maribacter hydrothermalis]|uniref:Uncharacterized protein n=1 Tax=Maribacter hydrothermalis TaxID=1836467 RepID=A0A1B7Z356_9FLAO|nr:hypothetical protein [Maribacter hydrothermalis]APQ18751.1 hypothetical protein BTR34_16130 [Maribacter hydrothermalis]OBR37172.1 hypothetical protein A9200_18335 [Maribacter hydrothermalis]
MKETFIGHKIKILNSEKTGITLELNSWSSENMEEKYSVSFDNENIIERIAENHLSFGEKVSKTDFFHRLIRDIRVSDEATREFASAILCDFLEFDIADFDLNILKLGIEKVIEQLRIEKNANVEQKLAEGLFEFIWHKRLSKKEEIELLERLTEIDSYQVWSYLGDEIVEDIKSYNSKKLNEYYSENIEKWKEKDIQLYGKEKAEKYYNELNKTSG